MRRASCEGSDSALQRFATASALALLLPLVLFAAPLVSNVWFAQRTNSNLVDVWYDLAYSGSAEALAVSLAFSTDGGSTFSIVPRTVSGDIGPGQKLGTRKHVVWDAGKDLPALASDNVFARVVADDGMAALPGTPVNSSRITLRLAAGLPEMGPERTGELLLQAAVVVRARLLRRWPTASSVKLEKNRMIVQLPDTVDRVRAERIVCKPGLLEFSLMASSAVTESVIERVNKYLGRHQVADLEMGASSSLYLYVAFAEGDLAVATSDVPFVRRLIDHVETAGICGEYRFCFGPEQRVAGRNVQKLYLLHRKPELSTLDGKVISRAFERAYVGADPSVTNTFIVDFALSRTANSRYNPIVKFAEVTQRFVGERLAIVLDSEVQSAPVIRSRIPDGSGMIMTGDRDGAKARELADILSTGALPVALEVVSDER